MLRSVWLIAHSVLIEAIRRREIYAIVLLSTLVIGAVMTVDFFGLQGLTKFYRETALDVMSMAAALTVIVLSARQLPREFEARTIYPLLAKPISRFTFLNGKLLGVMLASAFCFAIFMVIYVAGSLYLGSPIPVAIFCQYLYLQLIQMLILAALSFWLSMLMNLDAAITIGAIFYATSSTILSALSELYEFADAFAQHAIVVLVYVLPQLTLFDLSERAVHATSEVDMWHPLAFDTMAQLTFYGLFHAGIYYGFALFCLRRRAL